MKKALLWLSILHFSSFTFGQSIDSTQTPAIDTTQVPSFFSGVITATNNGISLLPNFSLNKPALLFDLSMGKGRFSFDPMFRFSMEGKPWTIILWGRYKLFDNKKFTMSIGAHPSFVFKTITATSNGITRDYLTAQRYFAWEATPTFILNKKVGIGIYYLGSHGLTKDLTQYTTFLAVKSIFSNIKLSKQFHLSLIPQLYFLKMDALEGTYLSATLVLSKHKFPLFISSIVSKAIDTEIAGNDFVWNIGLNYSFNNKYYKIRSK